MPHTRQVFVCFSVRRIAEQASLAQSSKIFWAMAAKLSSTCTVMRFHRSAWVPTCSRSNWRFSPLAMTSFASCSWTTCVAKASGARLEFSLALAGGVGEKKVAA